MRSYNDDLTMALVIGCWVRDTAVEAGKAATKSAALTNDVDLIPYIGIEAGAAAAEAIDVHWTSISRHVYE